MNLHTIHRHCAHYSWDHSIAPTLQIAPGESVEFEVSDGSGGQLTPASSVADLATVDFDRVNPVTGPLYVDGAEPGDQLKVTVLLLPAGGVRVSEPTPSPSFERTDHSPPRRALIAFWAEAPCCSELPRAKAGPWPDTKNSSGREKLWKI